MASVKRPVGHSLAVIDTHRFEKVSGGKMRPKVVVFMRYDLSCGHSVTRKKQAGQVIPSHMPCKECLTAVVE
jgi:hypothetical protein